MKKRRTGLVVFGVLVVLLGVGLGIFLSMQWNNIQALSYMFRYSQEERQELLENRNREIERILAEFPDIFVQPLPKDAEQLYQKGELTTDEALQIVKGEKTFEEIEKGKRDSQYREPVPTDTTVGEYDRLQDLLAKVYVLKSGFTGKLNTLIGEAKTELNSPAGKTRAMDIAQKYIAKGNALEAQCDEKMAALTGEIREELKRTGKSTRLADEIQSTYETEKSIKKASIADAYQ